MPYPKEEKVNKKDDSEDAEDDELKHKTGSQKSDKDKDTEQTSEHQSTELNSMEVKHRTEVQESKTQLVVEPLKVINALTSITDTVATPEIRPVSYSTYAGYASLESLPTDIGEVPTSYSLDAVTELQHFFRVFINNDSGAMPHTVTNFLATDLDHVPALKKGLSPFADGVKLSLLGIDCNRKGAELILNPFSKTLLETNSLSEEKSILNMALLYNNGVENADESIIQYLAIAAYVVRVSSFIGNFIYVNDSTVMSKVKEFISDLAIGKDVSIAPISINTITDCTTTPFYLGRMMSSEPIFQHLSSNNIVNDDFFRYPRFEFCSVALPTEWSRVYSAIIGPPKFTALKNHVHSVASQKIYEYARVSTDVVMATLQKNGIEYLTSLKIDRDSVVTLLNYLFFRPADIQNNQRGNILFYKANITYRNNWYRDLDFTTFPISAIHRAAFLIGPSISKLCLTRAFRFLTSACKVKLSAFNPITMDTVRSLLADENTSLVNPGLTTKLTQINARLSSYAVTNETLSYKMALDLMSLYNFIPSPVYTTPHVDLDPVEFALDYVSMIITKHMYYNSWMRNQYAWYGYVKDFLLKHFPLVTRDFLNNNGFGRDANRGRVMYESNVTRDLDFVTVYYFNVEPTAPNFTTVCDITTAALINSLLRDFSLNNNAISVNHTTTFGPYGVKERNFRTPGACYAPVTGTTEVDLPIATVLNLFRARVTSYMNIKSVKDGIVLSKVATPAFNSLFNRFFPFITRFSQFFHCVYCPTYLLLARSPFLTEDDVETAPLQYKKYVALIDTHANRKMTSEIPTIFSFNQFNVFGSIQFNEAINLFFSAVVPGTVIARGDVYTSQVDYSMYGSLYDPSYPTSAFEFYKLELMRRHSMYEAVLLTEKLSSGELFTDMPAIRDALLNNYHLSSAPMVSWIYLGKLVGSTLGEQDSTVRSYISDYSRLTWTELRMKRPTIQYTIAEGNVSTIIPFQDCIRPVITRNSGLLFQYLFGNRSLRPLNQGLTLSYQVLPTPLTFRTVHTTAPWLIAIGNDYMSHLTTNYNKQVSAYITVASRAGTTYTVPIDPNNPIDLITNLRSLGAALPNYKPQFEFNVPTRPTHMTPMAKKILYKLYVEGCLLVNVNHYYTYQYYSLKDHTQTDDRTPLSESEFLSLLTKYDTTLLPIESITNEYLTNSNISFSVAKNILPAVPLPPQVVCANGLFGEIAPITTTPLISTELHPEPAIPIANTQVVVDALGNHYSMLTRNPFSLNTIVQVYFVPPITWDTISVTNW